MVVYIEYAFLQNFLFDGALLCLALVASKMPLKWWKITLSAACGGFFAVIFPLLRGNDGMLFCLKIAVGLLLCIIPIQRLKNKKDWGRYALTAVLFFTVTFCFGGALTGIYTSFSLRKPSHGWVGVAFCLLCVAFSALVSKLYQKKENYRYIYPCFVSANGIKKGGFGYLDSGNLASKNGLPVCFLSPDLFYDIFGKEIVFGRQKINGQGGQVRDEMQIVTLAGNRTIPLFKGEIQVKKEGKYQSRAVYFAMVANRIEREYNILLNARIFEDEYEH